MPDTRPSLQARLRLPAVVEVEVTTIQRRPIDAETALEDLVELAPDLLVDFDTEAHEFRELLLVILAEGGSRMTAYGRLLDQLSAAKDARENATAFGAIPAWDVRGRQQFEERAAAASVAAAEAREASTRGDQPPGGRRP